MSESKRSFIDFKSKDGRTDSVGGVLGMVDDMEIVGDSDEFDSELDDILDRGTALHDIDFRSDLGRDGHVGSLVSDSGVKGDDRVGSAGMLESTDLSTSVRQGVSSELVRVDSCCDNQIRLDMDSLSQPFGIKRASIPIGYFYNFLGKIRKEADRYGIDLNRSRYFMDFKKLYLNKLDIDIGYVFYFRTVTGLYTVVSSLNRLMSKIVDDLDLLRKDSFLRF